MTDDRATQGTGRDERDADDARDAACGEAPVACDDAADVRGRDDEGPKDRRRGAMRRVTASTRFIAIVPAIGFMISAVVLAVSVLVHVVMSSIELAEGAIDVTELAIEYVEYADLFLLAVVLYILALGLISLFVTERIPVPSWLSFDDFDDLKERLVSVINVMLGVYFLGRVLNGASGPDIMWLGLACAIVIVALTLFVRIVIKGGHDH